MGAKILVIGATGTVGGETVKQLVRKGEKVRAATRNPSAAHVSGLGVEFVEFDYERPGTFGLALEDVDRVFMMARPGDDESDRVASPLIREMKQRGIRRVVNLTAMGVRDLKGIALARVEQDLENSGLGFTHLRPNWFMQIFSGGLLLADIRANGAIHVPAADARISYIDSRDIAAVAAAALREDGHCGRAYTLTGPEALDFHRVAQTISSVSGRSVQYVPIDDDTARGLIRGAGLSEQRAERLIGFYSLVRKGFCAPVSGDVARVLGRAPATFDRFAAENASCWSPCYNRPSNAEPG